LVIVFFRQEYAKALNIAEKKESFPVVMEGYGDKLSKKSSDYVEKKTVATVAAVVPGGIKKEVVGRKPIRVIVSELEKRLEILKSNPKQLEILTNSVEANRNPMPKKLHLIQDNKIQAGLNTQTNKLMKFQQMVPNFNKDD
jgi:hypothetical protein